MKLFELISIKEKFDAMLAETNLTRLRRRKLGFRFEQLFNQHEQIIQTILLDSIIKANRPFSENENIRLPKWISQSAFDRFISKITLQCG